MDFLWLVPALPLLGSAINGLLGKRLPKPVISLVACGSVGVSFLVATGLVLSLIQRAPEERHVVQTLFTWIAAGDFVATAEFLLDPLSAVMILVVTGVGFLIHVYSIGYMHAEDGYYRFFSYLNLFMFSMLVLVLASNFLLMFVGWEGVGLCSYLLIGYYFDRKSAGDAGKKAFIVNRIGDVGFILGILLIFATFGSMEFDGVFRQISQRFPAETDLGILTGIALLLFVGATGKSAQIPLYVWLPDAMEGPTPVSALIHAATMVTAGVYMVVRCSPIYSRAPFALEVVAIVGTLTAFMAATIGLVQTDIKRVLAYSTVSQLGYMFAAAGVGAYSAGIFHLMTHAFFKALLFLGAGSVIHAMGGEQNLLKMGGLRKHTPITFLTMVVGLTAFYMFRLVFLTFSGEERMDEHTRRHLHESPASITVPLVILAVLSVMGGWVGLPAWMGVNRFAAFLEPSLRFTALSEHEPASHALEAGLAVLSVAVAAFGIGAAYNLYVVRRESAQALARRFAGLHALLSHKYYVDEIYDALFVNPAVTGSREVLWKGLDVGIIDGSVNGVGRTIQGSADLLKHLQNGLVRSYASWILAGTIAVLFYIYSLIRR